MGAGMWSVGTMLVALLAAAAVVEAREEGWRMLVRAVNTPLLLTAVLAPFLAESPHWLAQKGKHRQAARLLRRIAQVNGVPLPRSRKSSSPPPPSAAATLTQQPAAAAVAPANGGGGYQPPTPSPLTSRRGVPAAATAAVDATSSSESLPDVLPPLISGGVSVGGGGDGGGCRRTNYNPVTGSTSELPALEMLSTAAATLFTAGGGCGGGGVAQSAAATAAAAGGPEAAATSTLAGIVHLLSDARLRRRSLLHWALWAISGFGW